MKLHDAYGAISGVVGPDAASAALTRIINVEQLLLQTVGVSRWPAATTLLFSEGAASVCDTRCRSTSHAPSP